MEESESAFSLSYLQVLLLLPSLLSNSNWSEWSTIQGVIGRVISKSAEREARGRFEITSTITTWIVRHEVQLLINHNYNKIREEYDSGLNYLTGIYIQLLSYMPKKKSHSSATSASLMTRTVQLLRHDAYNCPITSAWRVQLSNYGWNQVCWGPIRFENFDIVVIIIIIIMMMMMMTTMKDRAYREGHSVWNSNSA